MRFNQDLNRRLSEVENFLHQVWFYLGISPSGIPVDATRSLNKLFQLLASLEADSIQKVAKFKSIRAKIKQKQSSSQSPDESRAA